MKHASLTLLLAGLGLLIFTPTAESTSSLFERKQTEAIQQVQTEMNRTGWPKTADEALELFKTRLKDRKPLYEGYDHPFEAFAKLLAVYARQQSENSDYKDKAPWHFVAGEAMYAHAQSGKEDFQKFLRLQILDKDDPRIEQAKARLKKIERFEKGMSRK